MQESFLSFYTDMDFAYLNGFSYITIFKGLVQEHFYMKTEYILMYMSSCKLKEFLKIERHF